MSETFIRFVSATRGRDTATNGRKDTDPPLKTINAAMRQLVRARRKKPQQSVHIVVEPGTYEEVVILNDRCSLSKQPLPSNPTAEVRLRRPKSSSSQGERSASPPTADFVLKIQGELVSVNDIVIDCERRPQRGVLIRKSKQVTLDHCKIVNCHSTIFGGTGRGTRADPFTAPPRRRGTGAGIRIQNSEAVEIKNCQFDNNRNKQAFRQTLYDREIKTLEAKLSFVERQAYKLLDGPAKARKPVKIRNGGGHISIVFSRKVKLTGCTFTNGFCGGRGGALQLGEKAYATVKSCRFEKNRAGIDGGAVCVHDPGVSNFGRLPVTFVSCFFENNTAEDDGGGLFVSSNSRVTVKSCVFKQNKAHSNGGALRMSFGAKVDVIDCNFRKNEANIDASTNTEKNHDGGGAIACRNCSLKMKGGSCVDNRCRGFAGGAIYFITAKYDENTELGMSKIHGHTFDDILKNSLKYNFKKAELRIENTKFDVNKADDFTCYDPPCTPPSGNGMKRGGAGGAIYVLESLKNFGIPVEVNLSGLQVSNNLSTHRNNNQQSEMVFRNIEKLTVANDQVVRHSQNKFLYSLIKVRNKDVSKSKSFGTGPTHES